MKRIAALFVFLFAVMINVQVLAGTLPQEVYYGKKYFIDKMGHKVKTPVVEEEKQEAVYVNVVKANNGLYGVKNIDDDWIIEPQFEEIADKFTNGVLSVKKDGKWGAIDNNGNLIIEPSFKNKLIFNPDLALASRYGAWGYIDKTGSWVISPKYEDALNFHNGLAAVKLDNKWGYIDDLGNWFITPRYYGVLCHDEGYVSTNYFCTSDFHEGMAAVYYDIQQEGYIDLKGNVLVKGDFWLTDLQRFSEGLAAVKKNGKYGYINKRGQFVIKPKYVLATPFKNGMAQVVERNIRAEKKAERDYKKQVKKQLKEQLKETKEETEEQ